MLKYGTGQVVGTNTADGEEQPIQRIAALFTDQERQELLDEGEIEGE